MKRIFVCLVMTVITIALYAQQKQVPSFRDYLNNKNSLSIPAPEKFSLPGINTPGFDIHTQKKSLVNYNQPLSKGTNEVARFDRLLANGNKLYILPQDNMPCVVPDLSGYSMPVAKGRNDMDKGINALSPQRLIP